MIGGRGVRVSAEAGNFFLHYRTQTGSGAHPISYPTGNTDSFSGDKAPVGVKLTTHFRLVPRSKMRGAIPRLPQYVSRGVVFRSKKAEWQLYPYLYLCTKVKMRIHMGRSCSSFPVLQVSFTELCNAFLLYSGCGGFNSMSVCDKSHKANLTQIVLLNWLACC
jgi:hypothetical protein